MQHLRGIGFLPWFALLVAALLAWGAASPAAAAASPWAETEHGRVRLIAAVEAVGSGGSLPLGLEFEMADGWKIYWRSPGDAGFPPRFALEGAANVGGFEIAWPAPVRFSVQGFETIGYERRIVLPIDARLTAAGAPVTFAGRLDYLTCKEICVPYSVDLALSLPAGAAGPSRFAEAIALAAARLPAGNGAHGLTIRGLGLDPAAPALAVDVLAAPPLAAPDLFVEGAPALSFGRPSLVPADAGGGGNARLLVPVAGAGPDVAALAGRDLTLTLVDGERAIEHAVRVGPPPAVIGVTAAAAPGDAPAGASQGRSLAAMLAVALLGGLILNLMPCVLPVLSLKLLAVVGHGGGDRRRVRLGFLASAAGIAASFLVLALALILVRNAGIAAGWGLQFQQPLFLVAMTLVTTLFACNLWGLFEVPLPARLAIAGSGSAGRGDTGSLGGHFLTGALATLLATPCSAPFLGTAIGFALAAGPARIVAVFMALAAGLALPYLAVAAFPGIATRLPRPGAWMEWLRRILGIALAATALWLIWVLAAAAGRETALAVAGLAAAVVLVLAGRRWLPDRLRRPAGWMVAGLALAALALPLGDRGGAPAAADGWRPLRTDAIAGLVAAGQVVFVNVTADWCLTCKVNERLVLARPPVATALASGDVVAMQGDWTRPDETIARYLAGFGRYGIPFDAVYGPGLPQGEALPELLTAAAVLAAIERARGTGGADRIADRR